MALGWAYGSTPASGQEAAGAPAGGAKSAIIIHDGAAGDAQAAMLGDLLGHFSIQPTIVTDTDYTGGSLENYDVAIYLKRDAEAPVSTDLISDLGASEKTVVWLGTGFDQFTRTQPMESRYGFSLSGVASRGGFEQVTYNNRVMRRPVQNADILAIVDPGKAKAYAQMIGKNASAPYIVQGKNLWRVVDNPLKDATQFSTYLAFADVLHDIVGINHSADHIALIRIEDVHPQVDQDKLRAIADYLYSENIPFSVALIPVYVNPYNSQTITMSDSPGFAETIRYMQSRGGSILLHGYTHQYRGETAVDYEFWDGVDNTPPSAESEGWVKNRLASSLEEAHNNGIYPIAWETPHYTASDFTSEVIARYFPVYYGRRGRDSTPYIIESDRYGQRVIPETMGYVRRKEDAGSEPQVPQTGEMIGVRDGIASAFFHPFMDISLLKELITEVRRDGFHYVPLDSLVGDSLPREVDMSVKDRTQNWVSGMKQAIETRGTPGLGWISLLGMSIIFYYVLIFGLGRRVRYPDPAANPDMLFIFVIPALNEEDVIASTLDHLLALPDDNVRVLVMNDNSDDRTADIVQNYTSDRVILVNRPPAVARRGKGDVLNHAYKHISGSPLVDQYGKENIILVVLDADGQVKPDIIRAVTPYFINPRAAAVQTSVRIFNPVVNVLTRWQQFEFLTFNRVFQRGRESIGSVGLGGNGQFVRLAALQSLGEEPWSESLTEDLDIGLRLMLGGWENHFAGRTYVAQQAVTNLRALVRQRSRWFQGHVSCWVHIPRLLGADLRLSTRIDTIYYLLGITLVYLFFPASVAFFTGAIVALVTGAVSFSDILYGGFWPYLVLLYILSFGPLPILAYIYWKEDENVSLPGALIWAHLFTVVYYVWFVAGCVALTRLVRGQQSWAKTPRSKQIQDSSQAFPQVNKQISARTDKINGGLDQPPFQLPVWPIVLIAIAVVGAAYIFLIRNRKKAKAKALAGSAAAATITPPVVE